jgi:hypothetical protein
VLQHWREHQCCITAQQAQSSTSPALLRLSYSTGNIILSQLACRFFKGITHHAVPNNNGRHVIFVAFPGFQQKLRWKHRSNTFKAACDDQRHRRKQYQCITSRTSLFIVKSAKESRMLVPWPLPTAPLPLAVNWGQFFPSKRGQDPPHPLSSGPS